MQQTVNRHLEKSTIATEQIKILACFFFNSQLSKKNCFKAVQSFRTTYD